MRSWADERIAAQTEQMERQSEEAKVVAARSKEETKVEVAQLMGVSNKRRLEGVEHQLLGAICAGGRQRYLLSL